MAVSGYRAWHMVGIRIGAATAIGWLLVLAVVVAGLTTVGDSAPSALIYVGIWLVSTTMPGVLVWRALARPTSFVQELGFGSVLGIALLLLFAWLPATLVGVPLLMWWWPVGVIVAFVAVPSWRRHWWPRRPPNLQTKGRWHVAMMAVCGLAFARMYVVALEFWPLPPKTSSTIFQDAWYHPLADAGLGTRCRGGRSCGGWRRLALPLVLQRTHRGDPGAQRAPGAASASAPVADADADDAPVRGGGGDRTSPAGSD